MKDILFFKKLSASLFIFLFLILIVSCQNRKYDLREEIKTAKWISIFNGKDLHGWEAADEGKWEVSDGILTGSGAGGLLISKNVYQDFHLRIKFQINENGKGGLYFRYPSSGGGYKINIDMNDARYPTGSISGVARAYPAYERFKDKIVWHKLELWAEGDRFIVYVDNSRVAEGFSRDFFSGSIGFEAVNEGATLKVKEVSVLELSQRALLEPTIEEQLENAPEEWRSLFNGKDLTGWKQPSGTAKWTVKDGIMTVSPGGAGWLFYFDEDFSDFIFRLKFKVGMKSNSGVAYRYNFAHGNRLPTWFKSEIQIIGNDNIEVHDGAGSIYSLARNEIGLIKAGEWNEMEVYALGPHVATYINGKKAAETFNMVTLKGAVGVSAHDPDAFGQFKDIEIKSVEW